MVYKEDINSETGTYQISFDTYKPKDYSRIYFRIRDNGNTLNHTDVMIYPSSEKQHIILSNAVTDTQLNNTNFDIQLFFINYDPFSPWYIDNLEFKKV